MHLNLGHTFGHAIELLSNYKIPHGYAVAIGTVMAAEYALEKGFCSQEVVEQIRSAFEQFGFDLTCEYSKEAIFAAMQHDKKKKNGVVRVILPVRIGEVVVRPLES